MFIPEISAAIQELVQQHLRAEYSIDLEPATIEFSRPQQVQHGDLTTPIALQLAKQLGKSPRDIATELLPVVQQHKLVEKCEIAGAGYINMWLAPSALIQSLQQTVRAAEPEAVRDEAPVIMEYSSINIAKPLGIHHVLSTCIGQVLANLFRHQGYLVEGVNHIGDWGTQYGKLYVACQKWGTKNDPSEYTVDELLDLYVKFHNEADQDDSLENEAREAFRSLEQGNNDIRMFWEAIVKISMEDVESIYKRLGVHIEHVHGESMYEGKMQPIIEEGKQKNVFKAGEQGALISTFPEETNMPPALILKSDGSTIYHTRDLATIRYRLDRWSPQAIYHVVGAEQSLYFQQLFHIGKQLEWNTPTWEHVSFGRMRFSDKSMSTRKGNVLKLNEVLDEAAQRAKKSIDSRGDAIHTDDPDGLAEMMGVGSVVYGILSQNRRMDMIFDWDKVLSFDGNSAPYIQYSYARTQSVLRKAEVEADATDVTILEVDDRSLILTLLELPDTLKGALKTLSPHVLANYLYRLCQQFNTFYNNSPILKAEQQLQQLRLYLTKLTGDVITCLCQLLLVPLPASM